MARAQEQINPSDYGLVREPTEGTLYLMKKSGTRIGWAKAVGVKADSEWRGNPPKYMVLSEDIQPIEKSRLLKILKEIKSNGTTIS